jgi:hypothetical protein
MKSLAESRSVSAAHVLIVILIVAQQEVTQRLGFVKFSIFFTKD